MAFNYISTICIIWLWQ